MTELFDFASSELEQSRFELSKKLQGNLEVTSDPRDKNKVFISAEGLTIRTPANLTVSSRIADFRVY